MAVTAVVFDVGETLVDETRQCEAAADACGVPRFTFMALAGAAIERGLQPQEHVFDWLGVERPATEPFTVDELYPDALPCIEALRARGLLVGAAGNMNMASEAFLRPYLDFVASSERMGLRKPEPGFFERIAGELGRTPGEIAYVGDRVDNDVLPAKRAGMLAVHIRRGPWGYLHDASEADAQIDSLDELAEVIA